MEDNFDYTGKYICIDEKYLRNQELTLVQMVLLSMIENLQKRDGYCMASNRYFARFIHATENTVVNNLDRLEAQKYIKRETKGRDRRIRLLNSPLDEYLRNEYEPKILRRDDPKKWVNPKIGLTEDSLTQKIVVDEPKNCGQSPKKFGTINIYDKNTDIMSIQAKDSSSVLNNNRPTPEPCKSDIFSDSEINPAWNRFKNSAIKMQTPVYFMSFLRDKFGAGEVKISRSEFITALDKPGVDPALVLYSATLVYGEPGKLSSTVDGLNGGETRIPADIQTAADDIVGRILSDAQRNFGRGA